MKRLLCLMTMIVAMTNAGTAAAEEFNPVVGKVGQFVLREADMERLVAQQPSEIQQGMEDPARRTALVRQILLAKGVAARARKAGFDRKPEIKEQLSYLVDNFLAQEYVRTVILADVAVPEEKLREYYTSHQAEFTVPPEVTARHIFFGIPDDATAERKKEVRGKAERILSQLLKGEDFEQLAREVSEDAETAAKGGQLGVITPGKTNSPGFEEALFPLKKGETSGVVETEFGFHIVRVDERKEQRTATYDESRGYILNILQGEAEQKKALEFLELITKEDGLEIPLEKAADGKEAAGK